MIHYVLTNSPHSFGAAHYRADSYPTNDFGAFLVSELRRHSVKLTVNLLADGRTYTGRGLSTDVIEASIVAYIKAMNRLMKEED